ncbi:hypothetical protein [Natrarchaeobaculum aegyptiacum]|nr:hypothetical protein [Natrarchaeobaculum aegyptiacum]
MDESGEIKYHEQDGYADDPSQRSDESNEHVEQARRFAQYYVYAERGYDTVPPDIHPERIDAVRQAIQTLTDAEFDALFGELKQQLQSYHDDTERAILIPADAAGPNSVLYRQHVYLGIDTTQTEFADEVETLATVHGINLKDADTSVSELSDSTRSAWQSFTEQVESLARNRDIDASDALEIGGVSSLYTAYVDSSGREHIGEPADDPFNREPDTLIELAPIEPGSLEQFREYFDHYLQCQIRDCFVRMGLHPPEEFCVLGPGRIEAAEQYKRLEMYPDFTDPDNDRLLATP